MKDYKKLSESTFNIQAETYDTDKNGKHACLVYNKNTQNCRGDSPKLQREIPQ